MHRHSLLTDVRSGCVRTWMYGWNVHNGEHSTPRQAKKKMSIRIASIGRIKNQEFGNGKT